MKIQICSDLHLEFAKHRDWLNDNPLIPAADILIIAGDTYYLEMDYAKLDFINKVSNDFDKVYLIPGNHEYYGGYDISTALEPTCKEIKQNVFMLNNQLIQIDGVTLIFSTMWSKIENYIPEIMQWMTDFKKIKYKGKKFTTDQCNEIHELAFRFITDAVKSEGKKVVVTHHLPSSKCTSEEFKHSPLGDAFCVDKTEFIMDSNIDFWVYGHSHRNLNDFKIGNTELITNQFGYIAWNEHVSFNYGKVIEIE
jgi:predicted phosphohydrolase